MPKKTSPRMPEDLGTTTHQRPEGYYAQKIGFTSARRPLDHNTSKTRMLPCSKNQLHVSQKTFGLQHIKGQKATMPKQPSPRLTENLWTASHQRPEGYHALKTGSTSARRPFDGNKSKARRLPCPRTSSTTARRPLDHNTSKARRLPCPKNQLQVCQKTFGPQHIKGQKATMPKKPVQRLPEDLWTTTHQRPEGYHAQENRLHNCQKTFGPQHIKDQKPTMPKKPAPRLPEDLLTAKHQRPEGYHAQKNNSTNARRPLDRNTSKSRRLPCLKNRLLVC